MNTAAGALQHVAAACASACYLRACELDVAVRKPGNVSRASAGHGMQAELFVASARASVGPLFQPGARVGERIEGAVHATWAVAGCNTNLGILLLCAPIARAIEQRPDATTPAALRAAIEEVLAELDLSDAKATYRAIAHARPGGLGSASSEDVRGPAQVDLRAAMTLAAHRDSIARQYRDGYVDLFGLGLSALDSGFSLMTMPEPGCAEITNAAAVLRLYLTLLSRYVDSHIVRNHGDAVAHIVMAAAQGWRDKASRRDDLGEDPEFAAWDASLKADRINPGTTADLTVATLLIAGLTAVP